MWQRASLVVAPAERLLGRMVGYTVYTRTRWLAGVRARFWRVGVFYGAGDKSAAQITAREPASPDYVQCTLPRRMTVRPALTPYWCGPNPRFEIGFSGISSE